MYDIDELNLEESFSTDSKDLFKDNLDFFELDSLDGDLWNNRVIIEVDSFMHDKIQTKSGLELYTDYTYEISTHGVRSGIVAKIPKRLVFWDEDETGMYWKTTIEAEVGDRVWTYGMAIHSGEKIKCNGKLYVVVSYADLYVAKKPNEDVVCLNGNVLLKPKIKTVEALSFNKQQVDPDFAEIAYIGSKNECYEADYREDDENLKQGMTVCISGIIPRRLEIKPFLSFEGEQEFIVCQNYEIQGWLE